MDNTGFVDRSGKALYVGDIIQWRLGKFAKKSAGPTHYQLVRTKKGIKLMNIEHPATAGWLLRKTDSQFITLIDTSERLK